MVESEVGSLDFGKYSFMEKHYFEYETSHSAPYVEIKLVDFSGVLLERITVFYSKFVLMILVRNNLIVFK